MIIEKESEIKVLRNFYQDIFSYFSVMEISQRTNISRNWVYKIISKFEKEGILEIYGKKYKLDLSNPFCKKLKLFFDSEFVVSLDEKTKNKVFTIINKVVFELNPKSVFLVGSVALNKHKKGSDVDLIVISKNKKIPDLRNCNIVVFSEKEFKEKYLKGDDFVISSLSFGKIIFDKEFLTKFFENPLPTFSQEVIQEKIKYCERLAERIYTLLKTDEKKAREELLFLVLQIARIILLKNKTIPKSKYDIPKQIKNIDKEIYKILKNLLENKKIKKEEIIDYIEVSSEKIK